MDSDLISPNQESNEQKAEFCKLTNEAAHRKYRRRSPLAGLSDEDGSLKHDRGSTRDSKVTHYERRNEDRVDDRRSSKTQHGRSSDSYKHSSRGSRHDEHSRYGKHADEDDRGNVKSSYRTNRESRGGGHSDSRDHESDHYRPRDRYRDADRYSRDRSDAAVKKQEEKESSSGRIGYDGRHGSRYDNRDRHVRDKDHRDDKRDYKSSRDYKAERTTSCEDSLPQRGDSNSKWETDDMKDVNGAKSERELSLKKDKLDGHGDKLDIAGNAEHKSGFVREDVTAKRPKLFSSKDTEARKDGSKLSPDQVAPTGSDSVPSVDAAKVSAMKAAELVNKNLTSTGFMTADQKKKLLWGNKKSTTAEEPSHRWNSATFSDRERQEKFNKLMGVKGEMKVNSIPASSQDAEKQRDLQVDLEKQYTAGLRRRDGRTVGLGL